jgi:hypothetical protein
VYIIKNPIELLQFVEIKEVIVTTITTYILSSLEACIKKMATTAVTKSEDFFSQVTPLFFFSSTQVFYNHILDRSDTYKWCNWAISSLFKYAH